MKVISQGRGSGKTYKLLVISDYDDVPILVKNEREKEFYERLKIQFNCPNARIIVPRDLRRKSGNQRILVDEGYMWLRQLFQQMYNVIPIVVTDSPDEWKVADKVDAGFNKGEEKEEEEELYRPFPHTRWNTIYKGDPFPHCKEKDGEEKD